MVSDKIQYVPFNFGKKGISPFFSIYFTQDCVLANLKVMKSLENKKSH